MIEMTKRGQIPEEKVFTGRCTRCMSEYKALRKDLTYECDYREASYTAYCQLPGCNSVVYFSQDRGR